MRRCGGALRCLIVVMVVWACCAAGLTQDKASEKANDKPASGTQVVVLGTGTPSADPERSGPAVAVVVNGEAYLVDAWPGVVRRAAAAD